MDEEQWYDYGDAFGEEFGVAGANDNCDENASGSQQCGHFAQVCHDYYVLYTIYIWLLN